MQLKSLVPVGTLLTLAAVLAGSATPAQADPSNFNLTLSVKEWVTDWTTWRINNVFFGSGRIQVSEPLNSATRLVSAPQLGVRYGNFIASGSYLLPETYPLSGSLESLRAQRHEFDANLGYYVLPGLAFTVGYKEIQQDYGGGPFHWKGPTAGLAGSAPLGTTSWAVYGLAGYGLMKLTVPYATRDAFDQTSFDANYELVEAGLAYVISGGRFVSALRFTASYRAQILTTKGYKLIGANGYTSPNERDFTEGPAIGLSASF
jgi:hypothetical protein